MTTAIFNDQTVSQIEKYSRLWFEQMPKSGLSFRIQFINNQYRTVVLGFKSKSDIICTDARDIIDFSPLAPTPDAGWNQSLLDKYAFMLKYDLTFTAEKDVFDEIEAMLKSIDKFKEVDTKTLFNIIKKGKFSLDDIPKANQHPKLIFNAIKAGNRYTHVGGNTFSLFIKNRAPDSDDDDITDFEDIQVG